MYRRKTICFVDTLSALSFCPPYLFVPFLNSFFVSSFFSDLYIFYNSIVARNTVERPSNDSPQGRDKEESLKILILSKSLAARHHVLLYGQEAQEAGSEEAEGTSARAAHGPREFGHHQQARPKCC
jgi:hypothetical protein